MGVVLTLVLSPAVHTHMSKPLPETPLDTGLAVPGQTTAWKPCRGIQQQGQAHSFPSHHLLLCDRQRAPPPNMGDRAMKLSSVHVGSYSKYRRSLKFLSGDSVHVLPNVFGISLWSTSSTHFRIVRLERTLRSTGPITNPPPYTLVPHPHVSWTLLGRVTPSLLWKTCSNTSPLFKK